MQCQNPNCGKTHDATTPSCPHCGYPNPTEMAELSRKSKTQKLRNPSAKQE